VSRGRGRRIPLSTRARIAIALAKGASKSGTARKHEIGRETLRQWFEKYGFARWVKRAKELLQRGWRECDIEHELIVNGAPQTRETSPEESWASVELIAEFVAASAAAWNKAHRIDLLETDPGLVLTLAAEHVGESNPGPHCQRRGEIARRLLDAALVLANSYSPQALGARATAGKFIPKRRTA
jgi:transposase-like protein